MVSAARGRAAERYVSQLAEKDDEMTRIKEMKGSLVFLLFLLMSGCAPTLTKIVKEELSRLNNQSDIQAVVYPPSSFTVRTPGRAIAGGGGALGAIDFTRVV